MGDTMVARARRHAQATIPEALRPDALHNACVVEFEGWSGACSGMGTDESGTDSYVCEIVLPSTGGVQLGASFSGVMILSGEPSCPAIAAPASTTTTTPGATTTTTLPPPSPFLQMLDALADGLLGRAVEQGLGKLGVDFTTRLDTAVASGSVRGTVTALGTGRARDDGAVVLARGKARIRKGVARLTLKPTRRGRKFIRTHAEATVPIAVDGTSGGMRDAEVSRLVMLTR